MCLSLDNAEALSGTIDVSSFLVANFCLSDATECVYSN